jgi:hypothetical protein
MILSYKNLFGSRAFHQLRRPSRMVLFRFLRIDEMSSYWDEWGTYVWEVVNNGKLVFTYKEAEKLGLSRKQLNDAIDGLIEVGFLAINHQGKGPYDPTTYFLAERWRAYGTKHFKPAPERKKSISKKMIWDKYNNRKEGIKK